MQVSEAWLRELVNPPVDTDTLVAQLTMAGLEVDAVEPVAGDFSGVVVAEVLSMVQHPNADKLRVCQVNIGQSEPLQIVCGASNVRPGLKIPAALIGAVLPGDFRIQKSKLRGELSFGMLCSEKELGLASSSSGLMELPEDATVGLDIREYLKLNDHVIELGLTPNRADCLSVEGIAREIAVLNQVPFIPVSVPVAAIDQAQVFDIQLEAPEACPVYLGRLIQGVRSDAQTPLWMQEKLRRSAIRSLSPVVDVTNYVLLELGQPLHAFDADRLHGGIVVRYSRSGETLALLNDQTIELDDKTLVIADQNQALALAGVMGGKDSAVADTTQNIFLECAFFTPISVAGKARQYGLHTDSSHRFERGVDFELQERAIERATQLILEIAGGRVGPIQRAQAVEHLPVRECVNLRAERINKVLGINPDDVTVQQIFTGLGMQVIRSATGWEITPPACRFDIAIEEDLLEEVGRIYGYNNLPSSSLLMRAALGKAPEAQLALDRLQDALVDRGYQEAITYSFVDENILRLIDPIRGTSGDLAPDVAGFIRIQNPISSELAIMRTTLWGGLLNVALYNLNRQQSRVRLFETGLRFRRENQQIEQTKMLAGLALGALHAEQWGEKSRNIDFFDVKADVEALLALTGTTAKFEVDEHPALHPGQSARISNSVGETIGWLGMLHPNLEKQLGFDSPVFLFELLQEAVLARKVPKFAPLSKFPSVRRDMALLVEDSVSAAAIVDTIRSCNDSRIREIQLFDIYCGPGVAEGYKSVALSLILQEFTQTLTDTEIDAIFRTILEVLASKLNAKLRD